MCKRNHSLGCGWVCLLPLLRKKETSVLFLIQWAGRGVGLYLSGRWWVEQWVEWVGFKSTSDHSACSLALHTVPAPPTAARSPHTLQAPAGIPYPTKEAVPFTCTFEASGRLPSLPPSLFSHPYPKTTKRRTRRRTYCPSTFSIYLSFFFLPTIMPTCVTFMHLHSGDMLFAPVRNIHPHPSLSLSSFSAPSMA